MNRRTSFLLLSLFSALLSFGQNKNSAIYLKSGKINVASGISELTVNNINLKLSKSKKAALLLMQFENLPTEFERAQLAKQGIQLLDYIPDNSFTVSIQSPLSLIDLKQAKIKAVYELTPEQKMHTSLSSSLPPSYAVKVAGTVDLWLNFPKSFAIEEVVGELEAMNVTVLSKELGAYHVVVVRVNNHQLFQLAAQSFANYLSPIPPPDRTLNQNSRSLSHANVLNAAIVNGGRGLNGEGVTVGIGDNADIQYHVDFTNRLVNRAVADQQAHGTHTSGVLGGAGIINELHKGYLSKARIVSQSFTGIWLSAPTYVKDYNMVVTNNSYGAATGCDFNGTYTPASIILDQQAFDYPYLQHVFAAGNSGSTTCGPYPLGFRTVLGAYQTAKNVLTVGNTTLDGVVAAPSSRGPVVDGRLKPEITAQGTSVMSTWPGNTYNSLGGTSQSSPAAAGGLGLLYQRYRQLNNNQDPKSALMKALICNGASDKGNTGPDFKYGFGSMNLLRSLEMLEQKHYFGGIANNGSLTTQSITIPANTASLKVMLYWHDPAASLLSSKNLVNDLDLEVVSPANQTVLPLVLDSTFAHVDDLAVTGADHTNNIEQVVINNPTAGSYTVRVKGTSIAQNPSQEYFVVYDIVPNSLKLTYPVGGEGLVPGETVRIAWDSFGDEGSSFTLQHSIDGGNTWIDINASIPSGTSFYNWQVPASTTHEAMVRISKNSTGQTSTTNSFTIIGQPVVSLAAVQCEGYTALNWNVVAGATEYEILQLKGEDMVPVATTTNTSHVLAGLSKDSVYWLSVRARINGNWGRRSIAVSRQPNTGNCNGSISNNDLTLNALIAPVSGRKFTTTELSSATRVTVQVKNLDDAPVSDFIVKYSLDNGSTWVSEAVTTNIEAGQTYTHSFTTPVNFPAVGNYNLTAVVTNNNIDANSANDTLKTTIRHLANQPLNLSAAYTEGFEMANEKEYSGNVLGLETMERYDFQSTSPFGRIRTFVNSDVASSGKKALTLDASRVLAVNSSNFIIGTFNLSNYNVAANALRLDFSYKLDGLSFSDSNQVWIRGSESDPWISMYSTNDGFLDNKYKAVSSLELSDSLQKHNQNFSPSFQIRWGRDVAHPQSGINIDDVHLYQAFDDVRTVSIDTPYAVNCGLSNATPIKVTIQNSSANLLTNVPVKYSINNGAWITETIPAVAAKTNVQYLFTTKADMSNAGAYTVKVAVAYPSDNVRQNDTVTVVIQSIPLVTSFPYVQNFELDKGGWYSSGTNSSWDFGTPASTKIKGAASGSKAWKTRLAGNYNDQEFSYLYSPCFTISGLNNPALSFSMALDMENCGSNTCDFAWVDYSTDGQNWRRLADVENKGINWYNQTTDHYWSIENFTRWHVSTVALPKDLNSVRFRFGFRSDQAVNREGIAIDDIHIYDLSKNIYDGTTVSNSVLKNVSGSDWVHFEKDDQLILSVHPQGQNLGSTKTKVYINQDAVRYTSDQYYHDRNLVIKPTAEPSDSVRVRFYFLDREVESLVNGTGCIDCAKPVNAYELGVSSYHDYDSTLENGSIGDNNQGLWNFINSVSVAKVPFGNGYYAEFKVKEFSEFWLNTGVLNGSSSLPVKMLRFTAQKKDKEDVLIHWAVATESNVLRYEIEMARGADELQKNKFEKIGEVASIGSTVAHQQYEFVDKEVFKTGVRYYRLKTINQNGTFTYSVVRSVLFDQAVEWQVVPNPSAGLFYFVYYIDKGSSINMRFTDITGRLIKNYSLEGTAMTQKASIDISSKAYASGVYLLKVQDKNQTKVFKLYKQ